MSDRELLKVAIEALEHGGPAHRLHAIHALRARLAEPVQEPVAWMVILPDGYQFVYDERVLPVIDESIHATRQPLYTAPPARRPLTPAQEAAPELLEALREAYLAFAYDDEGPVWADSTIAKARAAIAKAEGA